MFLPSVIAAGLCYWQFERKSWKEDVIATKNALATSDPVDIFQASDADPYQPVYAEGVYSHQHSLYVGPRPKTIGPTTRHGYVLFTPLLSDNRRTGVLVNRGWVPEAWAKDPAARAGGEPAGRVRVEGVLQPNEQPSSFVPDNVPDEGRFFWISGEDLAEACGLPPSTPILQLVSRHPGSRGEASLEGDPSVATAQLPEPKNVETLLKFSVMPNDHLGYAGVWGTLSVALAGFALRFVRGGR